MESIGGNIGKELKKLEMRFCEWEIMIMILGKERDGLKNGN